MDIKKCGKSITELLNKYKYALLIFMIGILLMIIPWTTKSTDDAVVTEQINDGQITVEAQLEEILSCVQGAGNVKVMLKEIIGAETVYQTDTQFSNSDAASSEKNEVIIIQDAQRNETGLIKQINPPKYQGAVVLCQGADDPSVKLMIADAISKVTGLGLDKIAVLKMK